MMQRSFIPPSVLLVDDEASFVETLAKRIARRELKVNTAPAVLCRSMLVAMAMLIMFTSDATMHTTTPKPACGSSSAAI